MRILVLPGDGIGPEIVAAAMSVLAELNRAHGLGLDFEEDVVGLASLERHGTTLREELARRLPGYDGIILGPLDTAAYPAPEKGGINVSAWFRTKLDLYASIRPARTPPGLSSRVGTPLDLVIVRELTEGFYADRNMAEGNADLLATPDVAISLRKVTRAGSERIARRAFEVARRRRGRVCVAHKANVMKRSDGLFLEAVRGVAAHFGDVELDELIVDALAAWLVRDPARFDVILAENLYGDVLSDLAAELAGSIGLAGGLIAGDRLAAAQATHGAAPDIAGTDRANPASMLLSVALLLDWLAARHERPDLEAAARAIERALDATLADPARRTADLGGPLGTRAFAEAVRAAALAE